MKIGRMASASVSHVCRIPVSGLCITGLYSQSRVCLVDPHLVDMGASVSNDYRFPIVEDSPDSLTNE